jgi:hypothetical protein
MGRAETLMAKLQVDNSPLRLVCAPIAARNDFSAR